MRSDEYGSHKGQGVSTWLSLASAYALQQWASICDDLALETKSTYYRNQASIINQAVNQHCWDGDWYNRGFTDAGRSFGCAADEQGEIFLNPQSWALLAATPTLRNNKRCLTLSSISYTRRLAP